MVSSQQSYRAMCGHEAYSTGMGSARVGSIPGYTCRICIANMCTTPASPTVLTGLLSVFFVPLWQSDVEIYLIEDWRLAWLWFARRGSHRVTLSANAFPRTGFLVRCTLRLRLVTCLGHYCKRCCPSMRLFLLAAGSTLRLLSLCYNGDTRTTLSLRDRLEEIMT